MIPKGATHFMNGVYYKYGAHGFVYYWSDVGEWKRAKRDKLTDFYLMGGRYG